MKLRKIFAAALAAVMAAAVFAFPSGASFLQVDTENAKTIKNDRAVTDSIYSYGAMTNYKLKVEKSGKLKLSVKSEMNSFFIYLFNADGEAIANTDRKMKTGKSCGDIGAEQFYCYADTDKGLFEGTLTFPVEKGTYYIQLGKNSSSGGSSYTLTASFPTEEADSDPVLTITAKKGETLTLGVDDTEDKTKWSSSKKSVASVNQDGTVTAKKKGSAVITAKTGKKSLKIKVVVQ